LLPENNRLLAENNGNKFINNGLLEKFEDKERFITDKEYRKQIVSSNRPYYITFNQLVVDDEDEFYTYLDIRSNSKLGSVRIYGIDEKSSHINIDNKLIQSVKN
jgi:hypothetical protein